MFFKYDILIVIIRRKKLMSKLSVKAFLRTRLLEGAQKKLALIFHRLQQPPGVDLEQIWFEVQGLVFLGRFKVWFWGTNLGSGGLRFRIFRFVPIPNGKFTHFLIFYEVRTFGLVQGLVFFERFEV